MGMKVKYVLIVGVIAFSVCSLSAQEQWSLRDCIDYAKRENIQVRKSRISSESSEVDILQSKAALFPSLSGSVSQSFNNSKDPTDNYQYNSSFGGQYGVSLGLTIYNGKQNLNAIKQAELQKESSVLTTEQQENDIELAITQTYLQLLYAGESIKNNENIVASSEAQLQQTKDFLDAGSITRAEYAQVEAQYSSDRYNLVMAQNSYDSYLLQLKQLLELGIDDTFEPVIPEISEDDVIRIIPAKQEVYQTALQIMPEIRNSQLSMDLVDIDRSSAKAGYLPTISLNGSLGTNNLWSNSTSFAKQIDRNFSQSIGLSVSIPILDNRKNKSAVQKANLQIQTAELNYTQAQKDLLQTIENLHQDAVSAQSKYGAAKDKLASSELSYELVSQQYALGMRNPVELTTEQNNYANAMQELLQAKYTALLSIKLLNFYQGIEITL